MAKWIVVLIVVAILAYLGGVKYPTLAQKFMPVG